MILHHPSKELLMEFSAGSLGKAPSIAVATHLQFCPQCRAQVRALNRLGSACWETTPLSQHEPSSVRGHSHSDHSQPSVAPVEPNLFDKIMAACSKHDAQKALDAQQLAEPPVSSSNVVSMIGESKNHVHYSDFQAPKDAPSNALPDQKGIKLPQLIQQLIEQSQPLRWRHLSPSIQMARLTAGQQEYEVSLIKIKAGGRVLEHDHRGKEWTLVLDGAFSDHQGVYQAGDFLQQSQGHIHAPQATANKDCLCLSITEAPIQFTGWLSRLFNPFLSMQAR